MATNTYMALKEIVRTTKKSIPAICLAWFFKNVRHRCRLPSSHFGFRTYLATVLSQTLNPSF